MQQIKHKDAIIESSIYFGFDWYHPDYVDADWNGDHWISYGCGHSSTIEGCIEEIDEFLLEKHEKTYE